MPGSTHTHKIPKSFLKMEYSMLIRTLYLFSLLIKSVFHISSLGQIKESKLVLVRYV